MHDTARMSEKFLKVLSVPSVRSGVLHMSSYSLFSSSVFAMRGSHHLCLYRPAALLDPSVTPHFFQSTKFFAVLTVDQARELFEATTRVGCHTHKKHTHAHT